MKPFIYIYFRTRESYIRWKENDIPGVYALAVISLFQLLNLMSFMLIYCNFSSLKLKIPKSWIFFTFLGLVLLNYIFVNTNSSKKLTSYWKQEEKVNQLLKMKRGWFVLLYFTSSIAILIFCIVCCSQKN